MRGENLAATLGAAALIVGLTAVPASAGSGASQACTDGIGYLANGVTSPVTVSFEVSHEPTKTDYKTVWVCYSTTAWGQPNAIVGGALVLEVATATDTTYPGAAVVLNCFPDTGVSVGPLTCRYGTSANTAPFDAGTTPAGGTCLVAVNGACQYYLPGVAVYTDRTPYPLLGINVYADQLGTVPVPVGLPAQCVSVLATC
jgi:hypothetical protein